MGLGLLFWILMIVWLVFGFWSGYTAGQPYAWRQGGGSFLFFVLLAILGWKVFGPPIQ